MGSIMEEKKQEISDFLDRVAHLSAEDKKFNTLMRRSIGIKYNDISSFTRVAFLRAEPPKQMNFDKALFCAGLQCLWSQKELARAMEMPYIKHRLDKTSAATLETRILKTLDITWDSDGFLLGKIKRLADICKHKGYVVDCKHLLYSLSFWDSPSRIIQREWCEKLCEKPVSKKKEHTT